MRIEEFEQEKNWWKKRKETEQAWRVSVMRTIRTVATRARRAVLLNEARNLARVAGVLIVLISRALLIGTPARGWEGSEWLDAEPVRLRDLRGKVVLVRWWTDTCPFCRRSAPALNEFHQRYGARGLVVIGMYHPKPIRRSVTEELVRDAAEERGFRWSIITGRSCAAGGSTGPDGWRRR